MWVQGLDTKVQAITDRLGIMDVSTMTRQGIHIPDVKAMGDGLPAPVPLCPVPLH
jgi:glycine cleavage system aminomethyltransferase T